MLSALPSALSAASEAVRGLAVDGAVRNRTRSYRRHALPPRRQATSRGVSRPARRGGVGRWPRTVSGPGRHSRSCLTLDMKRSNQKLLRAKPRRATLGAPHSEEACFDQGASPNLGAVEVREIESLRKELDRLAGAPPPRLERRSRRRAPFGRKAGAHARRVHQATTGAPGDQPDGCGNPDRRRDRGGWTVR